MKLSHKNEPTRKRCSASRNTDQPGLHPQVKSPKVLTLHFPRSTSTNSPQEKRRPKVAFQHPRPNPTQLQASHTVPGPRI